MSDTIAAVATPAGLGAIAVLRLSGPDALAVAAKLGCASPPLVARRASLRTVSSADGERIDDCIVTFFRGPESFTGEDVVEVSCHGGYPTVRSIFRAMLAAGARAAEPGEFSRRAFANGKLDLAQAEGLNQLIRARTGVQMAAARQAYEGALSAVARSVSNSLTTAAAGLEASIDFPEDVEEPDREQLAAALDDAAAQLRSAIDVASRGKMLASGVTVAIAGRPNVGKSSLLNLLSGRSRAIVSDIPGTTRDFLEEQVEVAGLPVLAIDTAGIRETDDPLEAQGRKRAEETIQRSDICLVVLDASQGFTEADADVLALAKGGAVAVWNKTDLAPPGRIPAESWSGPEAAVCCLDGSGLVDLEQAILERLGSGAGYFEEAVAATERQVRVLQDAAAALDQAICAARSPLALDLAAVSLQTCRRLLGEITGETATETMIDAIFSSFCIGK